MKKIIVCLLFILPTFIFSQNEKKEFKVMAVGFYNLENLFDTVDVVGKNDVDFTPTGKMLWNTEKYIQKEANMAKVVSEMATEINPDGLAVLGVAEIENRKVIEDLVAQDALKSRNLKIVHYESPDDRGIDVGLIYNPKYFEVKGSKTYTVNLKDPENDKAEKWNTRDVLLVSGLLDGESMHFLVGHWPSRRGGEKASEWGRFQAAATTRHIIDSLYAVEPNAKIVFMGDLNDDPFNKSMKGVMRCSDSPKKLPKDGLYNPMENLLKKGTGTMAYRDAWSLFDQMVISRPLVSKALGGWQFYKPIIYSRPYLTTAQGTYKGYPHRTFDGDTFINGYSDHYPVYLLFLKEKV
jgi:hypothetical protein